MAAVYHYLGQQYHRILIEELTLLPSEELYDRALGSLRSPHPDLAAQMLATTNPGGPGHFWVAGRFVKGHDRHGKRLQAGVPFQGPDGNWRIFIPARIEDNPILVKNDPGYVQWLDNISDQALRAAWRDGSWDSFVGQFFSEFRERPLGDEPSTAKHVLAADEIPELKPWWHRWMGGDWGYDHPSVIYWFCENEETNQIHAYRELYTRHQSAVQLGVMIAEASADDLAGLPSRTMALSFDPRIWAQVDEGRTIAERIAEGIDLALGKGTALLAEGDNIPEPDESPSKVGQIVLRKAVNERAAGWMAVREVLRWKPTFRNLRHDEILPVLQIHGEECPYLIDTLPILAYNEKKPDDCLKLNAINGYGGDDPADALRYGVMAWKVQRNVIPLQAYLAQKLDELYQKYDGKPDPTTVAMVAQFHRANYGKAVQAARPAKFVRGGRPQRILASGFKGGVG